tara:strand:- start:986 stop:1300 length:315 start_codon:yes stop_codon:yes gene_type:complete
VLIDNNGDTLVTISIPQMNSIYFELLQKDSLMAQSVISYAKEVKLSQIVDSTQKDVESLRELVNTIDEDNIALRIDNQSKRVKLKNTRLIAIVAAAIATLLIIK